MKNNKTLYSTVAVVAGFIAVLSICWSLLCVSGAIPTFISPIAYERLNYSNLQALSETIRLIKKDTKSVEWDIYVLEQHIENTEALLYELPERRQYTIHREPISDLCIIISGHKKDRLGMIWAVTDTGHVMKIPRDAIRQYDDTSN